MYEDLLCTHTEKSQRSLWNLSSRGEVFDLQWICQKCTNTQNKLEQTIFHLCSFLLVLVCGGRAYFSYLVSYLYLCFSWLCQDLTGLSVTYIIPLTLWSQSNYRREILHFIQVIKWQWVWFFWSIVFWGFCLFDGVSFFLKTNKKTHQYIGACSKWIGFRMQC